MCQNCNRTTPFHIIVEDEVSEEACFSRHSVQSQDRRITGVTATPQSVHSIGGRMRLLCYTAVVNRHYYTVKILL